MLGLGRIVVTFYYVCLYLSERLFCQLAQEHITGGESVTCLRMETPHVVLRNNDYVKPIWRCPINKRSTFNRPISLLQTRG